MKIDPFTVTVLENFATINPAVWIKEGNIQEVVSPTRSVVARATVDTVFPRSFGFYRVNQFIQVLSMYQEPDVEFESTQLIVSGGMRETKLGFGDPSLFSNSQVPPEFKFASSNIKASISSVAIKDLGKAARILGVEDLVIKGDGTNLTMSALTTDAGVSSPSHTIQLGQTDKIFKAVVKHSNISLISNDYEIEVIDNKKKPSLKFSSDRVQYLVALDEKSEF